MPQAVIGTDAKDIQSTSTTHKNQQTMSIFQTILKVLMFVLPQGDKEIMEQHQRSMPGYRERMAAQRAQEAEQLRKEKAKWQNPTHLDRLAPYFATPRSTDSEFFRLQAGKEPTFGKDSWRRKFTEGVIVYVAVVHIEAEAWLGSKHSTDIRNFMGIFAKDEAHRNDVAWLKKVADELCDMYEGRRPVADDCENLIEAIDDESEWSELKLPPRLAEGADVCMKRLTVEDKHLPNGYLPSDGIVPYFYWEGTIGKVHPDLYK